MESNDRKFGLGRKLVMWLGSFVVIGFCMLYYFGMPLRIIVSAGVMTLVVTLGRHYFLNRP